MMLVHPTLENYIIFEENRVNVLILENQQMFVSMIEEFLGECNGKESAYVLSEEFVPMEIKKYCDICIDFFALELNTKKVLTKLYQELKEISQEEMYMQTMSIQSSILQYIEELIGHSGYGLQYDMEMEITGLFKLVDLKLQFDSESMVDKIIDYITIMQEFFGIKVFVFVNLKSYLMEEEIKQFYKQIFYSKVDILLIENVYREELAGEIVHIIDSDLCQVR